MARTNGKAASNGHRIGATARCASRSSASATAPAAWSRAATTTPMRKRRRLRPRPDARQPRRLPRPRHRVRGRLRRRQATRSARTCPRRSSSSRTTRIRFAEVPHLGVTVERGMTHDGLGKYLSEIIEPAPGPTADIIGILRGARGRRDGQLPAGRARSRPPSGTPSRRIQAGVAFVNAIPVFIGREPYWQRRFAEGGPADHRRRHQEPGRRHDHPPRPDAPVHGPRCPDRPHLPAELRRQHRLPQHARARAPRVQEDQQDERGHEHDRLRDRRRPTSTSAPRTTCRG